jgi:UDP-N-acetylglucosamine:LPS N-acetylglucosamine transferase
MKIAFVSSQGGHSGQIQILFTPKTTGKHKAVFITENPKVKSRYTSKEKSFQKKWKTYFFRKDYLQLYPWRYVQEFFQLREIFKREGIDCIVTNGAQISIPACLAARSLRIYTIFIDTVIRVKTPNWSARACYYISNLFLVQHPNMARKYGKKARYEGGIL